MQRENYIRYIPYVSISKKNLFKFGKNDYRLGKYYFWSEFVESSLAQSGSLFRHINRNKKRF